MLACLLIGINWFVNTLKQDSTFENGSSSMNALVSSHREEDYNQKIMEEENGLFTFLEFLYTESVFQVRIRDF